MDLYFAHKTISIEKFSISYRCAWYLFLIQDITRRTHQKLAGETTGSGKLSFGHWNLYSGYLIGRL